jgi:hypothetical protein
VRLPVMTAPMRAMEPSKAAALAADIFISGLLRRRKLIDRRPWWPSVAG